MTAGVALLTMGSVLIVTGVVSLVVAKRTGEVRSYWFGKHPENIARFEHAYVLLGIASLVAGAFIAVLGAGSVALATLRF